MNKENKKITPRQTIFRSFPKAGRTWIRVILDELGFENKIEYSHEQKPLLNYDEFYIDEDYNKGKDIILLCRDPRDIVVSYYFQINVRRGIATGPLSDFIRSPRYGIMKILAFYEEWDKFLKEHQNRHIKISYEQMSSDPVDTIKKILDFMNEERNEIEIKNTVDKYEFEKMQRLEKEGYFKEKYRSRISARDVNNADSYKCRKGKIGGYKEYLSEEDIKYCDLAMEKYRSNEVKS